MPRAKVWRTLEELNMDHERLCGEVADLKAKFESHIHGGANGMVGVSTGKAQQPAMPGKCAGCGTILTGKEKYICADCVQF